MPRKPHLPNLPEYSRKRWLVEELKKWTHDVPSFLEQLAKEARLFNALVRLSADSVSRINMLEATRHFESLIEMDIGGETVTVIKTTDADEFHRVRSEVLARLNKDEWRLQTRFVAEGILVMMMSVHFTQPGVEQVEPPKPEPRKRGRPRKGPPISSE